METLKNSQQKLVVIDPFFEFSLQKVFLKFDSFRKNASSGKNIQSNFLCITFDVCF